jgi:TfoX/Sxy family transcriptional regulator of competence genes
MASKEDTLNFILNQLSDIKEITWRKMMGEYLIYFKGKVVGGIYDDRFLVKKTRGSALLLPNAPEETPYNGAKKMLSLSDVIFDEHNDNAALIGKVFNAIILDI